MKDNREQIKRKVADHYEELADEYNIQNYLSGRQYSALKYRQYYIENMIENQEIVKKAKILDVGCGPGELIISLLKKDYNVWGVDISKNMIEMAIKKVHEMGFTEWNQASVGDIENINFGDSFFDVVVASGVIEYLKDDKKALREMNRVLKKGGYLILNVTNKYSYIKVLYNPYARLKQNPVIRSMFEFIKNGLLRKGKVQGRPWHPDRRVHIPKSFDRQLLVFGFEKIDYNYFHFSLFPTPFDTFFRPINAPISKKMEALTKSRFGILGGGYLVIARKVANVA